MRAGDAYLTWRRDTAERPYLYNPNRPAFSFFSTLLMYVGGAYALACILGHYIDETLATIEIFSQPYFGFLAPWLGVCSWLGERRNWQKFVDGKCTDMMLGPVEEIGEKK